MDEMRKWRVIGRIDGKIDGGDGQRLADVRGIGNLDEAVSIFDVISKQFAGVRTGQFEEGDLGFVLIWESDLELDAAFGRRGLIEDGAVPLGGGIFARRFKFPHLFDIAEIAKNTGEALFAVFLFAGDCFRRSIEDATLVLGSRFLTFGWGPA